MLRDLNIRKRLRNNRTFAIFVDIKAQVSLVTRTKEASKL